MGATKGNTRCNYKTPQNESAEKDSLGAASQQDIDSTCNPKPAGTKTAPTDTRIAATDYWIATSLSATTRYALQWLD